MGLFWSAALGWPLVWDQGEETAVQSPRGGTKIAWGGRFEPRPDGARSRQRFALEVVDGDLAAEVGRLVGVGAELVPGPPDGTVSLTDPDGYAFTLASR